MKLYWKIYPVLTVTTLFTLILSIWISFSVLPAHFEQVIRRRLDSFESTVISMNNPTSREIELLADSMNVVLRFFRNPQRQPTVPGHPPQGEREWRGIRLIQPPGADFYLLASGRPPSSRLFLLIVFGLGLFLSQALALALGLRSVFSRISTLKHVTSKFGERDLSARYPVSGSGDEIDKLGSTFNRMAEQIISLLGSHSELLNSVAHELRTPMARLSFALELARENPEAVREKLGLMEQDLFELDRLVSELLEFNRIGSTGALVMEQFSMKDLCLEAADGERIPGSDVIIAVSSNSTEPTVYGDHRLLLRAVSNLVRNSVRYARTSVTIGISSVKDRVEVTVADDGPGFPPGFTEKAVSPFVKGRNSKGSGLGLSIVSRILEKHGGSLVLSNAEGGGARVVVSIPEKKGRA